MSKSKVIEYEVKREVDKVSKKRTLLEILKILEDSDIKIVGDLKRDRKIEVLKKSLKTASDKQVKKFITISRKLTESPSTVTDRSEGKFSVEIELHPLFMGTKVQRFLNLGEYGEAVRVAFVRINNRIKKFTGLKIDGAPLMRMVFSRKNPIIALNSLSTVEDSDAQEGWMHIFEGCMLAFRNPSSHNDELEVEKNDATGILGLANYLMRLLDLKLKDTP